jgi:hypothetical protein
MPAQTPASNDAPHIAPAQFGPVTDRMLNQLRNVAYDATRGDATRAEAELLLAACGPLFDELIAHRTLHAGLARLDAGADNVIFLHT